jgi:hypothetical protein
VVMRRTAISQQLASALGYQSGSQSLPCVTTRHEAWTAGRIVKAMPRKALLGGLVVAFLLAGALCIAVGTAVGLASFRDVSYPDSATLLRIGDFIRSGHIYPDVDRPPYLVTLYGPLTYVLLAIPYRLAQAAGITPQVLVRFVIVGALCLCVLLTFLISRRLYSSRPMAWLCALFAVSALPMAFWTTQIRGDFLAFALSLLSLYWFLLTNARPKAIGAAFCAGIALLVKQTFIAVPIAIVSWLIYRRRYKDAFLWSTTLALTVLVGYAIAWWREPLMLKHIAALRHPILGYGQALRILANAVSQPVVPLAVIGGFLAMWKRTPERLLCIIYCIVAWLVASLTITQVGGAINYFFEPLVASAVLAGPGLSELQRKANRTPILVTAMLFLLLLRAFVPMLWGELAYLKRSYANAVDYQVRKTKWESFVSTVSGRRLLSTYPDVTVLSTTPEIPDPFLNSTLELRGQWNSGPVVAEINAGVYDLIVIAKGEAEAHKGDGYRGIRNWDDGMWRALKRTYAPSCVSQNMEIWLPNRGSGKILPGLSGIGCIAVARESGSGSGRH